MRRMFTTADALADGLTVSALRWGEARGRWRRVRQGVWVEGPEEPSAFERALADVVASNGVAPNDPCAESIVIRAEMAAAATLSRYGTIRAPKVSC